MPKDLYDPSFVDVAASFGACEAALAESPPEEPQEKDDEQAGDEEAHERPETIEFGAEHVPLYEAADGPTGFEEGAPPDAGSDGEPPPHAGRKLPPAEYLTGVQARLNALGYACGPVDGIYGPRSKTAVVAFQADHGLRIDGIPGPKTQARLDEVYQAST